MKSKMLAYTIFTLVVTLQLLSYWKYASLEEDAEQAERAAFETYFVGDDERLKMVGFSHKNNTLSIALAIMGLGEVPEQRDRLQANTQAFVYDKVCNNQILVDYLNQGNTISVEILNGDLDASRGRENIASMKMTASRCE
ncbi:hypothetical protein LRP49_07150 [Enterovibrio sp. ZSDZ35]|uniref:Uncharacterized protein n=1 Tax=Enterovibrio qingdaonensis TaxID=2899818 RepID=A0ABT5QJ08_9GAMM|nr:hypothetical protein [Enterovibrio sp. ZSDZ35]MDD1780977.1 hypothetical protein [Enterovibrio sp. ZSDZ35]